MTTRNSAPPAPWMVQSLQQGLDLLNAGKPEQAAECAQRVLAAKNDFAEAYFLLGLVGQRTRQYLPALRSFDAVVRLDACNCAAWGHMAEIFVTVGQRDNARKALEMAVANDDDNANSLQLIAMVMSLLGDHQEALTWFERAEDKQPGNANLLINHANCLVFVGKLDDAESKLREALGIQPDNPTAHWLLSGLRKADDREHVNEMEELIVAANYDSRGLAHMHYACGKELEDLEEWEHAFRAFDAGAGARRRTIRFDEQAEIEMYAELERLYTTDWLAEGPAGCEDASPIFVVGQPRTGTTLVERVISAHSQVHSAGELRNFLNEIRRLTDYRGPERFSAKLIEHAASVDPKALGDAYMRSTQDLRGGKPYFVDKLPSNFLFVPLILKALPNARIVHLRRGPMDACFASFKQLFTDAYPHSYDQQEMARHHARYYHLTSVWRGRFADRIHEIRYEDIARDFEPSARQLIDFVDIPWEDACLDFAAQKSAVATASAVQVRQPVHTKSIGRWRRYEQYLEPMRRVLHDHGIRPDFDNI